MKTQALSIHLSTTSHSPHLIAASLAVALLLPLFPRASSGSVIAESGAQSLFVDPSVRAGGMGRASSAVFWGNDPNYWSNPALLTFHHGIRYEWGKTQLVPDLATGVYFTSKRLTAGYWGLGLLVAGKPLNNVGGIRLDYGTSVATDVDGNPIGTFTSYEEIQSVAGAANILEFTEHVLKAAGARPPEASRFLDVGLGWTEKRTHVSLAPAQVTQDQLSGRGNTTTHDSGILFRLTPYNAIDYAGLLPGLDHLARIRADVSYGRSTQNYDDATITYLDVSQRDPVLRVHRTGWATHVALGLSSGAQQALRERGLGWLPAWISPLISWGKAWDRELPMIRDPTTGDRLLGSEIKDSGWELTLANIYSIRRGWIDDRVGTVVGGTSGWSLGLQLRDWMGFSYDRATVPQSIYLKPVHRKAFTVYVDPIKAWAAVRQIRGGEL